MKKLIKVTPFRMFLFVALLFGSDISARASGQSPAAAPGMVSDIQRPNPTGSNPKPEDATMAILAAFEIRSRGQTSRELTLAYVPISREIMLYLPRLANRRNEALR